jgi:hypothetical protein
VGNSYSGGTLLEGGTFDVAALGAAGSEAILFLGGSHAKLKIENSALSAHDFGNVIIYFGAGQAIDLAGLRFVKHAKATYDSGTGSMTVKSGHVTDTLHLNAPDPGNFKVKDDGHGGSKIVLVVPHAKPIAQAVAEKQVSDHQGDGHHAVAGMLTAFAADSFQFNGLAGLGAFDRGWMPDFHLGHDQHEAMLDAGSHESFGWTDPSHANPGHDAHMLSAHDFIL